MFGGQIATSFPYNAVPFSYNAFEIQRIKQY